MTRYAIAIFISLLFIGIGELNSSHTHIQSQRVVATYVAAEDAAKEDVEFSTVEVENFISSSSVPSTNIHTRVNYSSHSFARQRHSQTTKLSIHISPCRHKGHVTNIFNYNEHRSSLRVVYYLHTLCRLRI